MTYSFNISECGLSRCIACRTITVSSSSGACSQDEAPDCASVLSARCGKRCTSCGQPIATAIRPAQYRASASPGTSTTAKPPRCSLVSVNGPSVKTGEPLLASTLPTAVGAPKPAGGPLGRGKRPGGEGGRAAAGVDAAHGGRRVQTAVAEDEDTCARH